jgi:hypothetical protein
MIIFWVGVFYWGTITTRKEVGTGRFYCPNCRRVRPYKRQRLTRCFSVYFIPLFKVADAGESVECMKCRLEWKPQVLRLTPPSRDERTMTEIRQWLAQGLTIGEVRAILGRRGMGGAAVEESIGWAASGKSSVCTHCQRAYPSHRRSCPECGRGMSIVESSSPPKPKAAAPLRVDYNAVVSPCERDQEPISFKALRKGSLEKEGERDQGGEEGQEPISFKGS